MAKLGNMSEVRLNEICALAVGVKCYSVLAESQRLRNCVESKGRNPLFVYFLESELTPETTPASHVAGGAMSQDFPGSGQANGLDGAAQGNRAGQLDEGNVVAGTS